MWPVLAMALGVVLTTCDAVFHTRTKVLVYHYPAHGLSLFADHPSSDVFAGFLALSVGVVSISALAFRHAPAFPTRTTALLVAQFLFTYWLSGQVHSRWAMALHVLFMTLWTAALFRFDAKQLHRVVAFSSLLGLAGPLIEGTYTTTGFFSYTAPNAYHVPIWLGAMYLNGALGVVALTTKTQQWIGAAA